MPEKVRVDRKELRMLAYAFPRTYSVDFAPTVPRNVKKRKPAEQAGKCTVSKAVLVGGWGGVPVTSMMSKG